MEKPAEKITLSESVYNQIRRDIMTNQLRPGEKIVIRELCERYKVSETPVRLALNRLASENVIENFPRQGMRVKALNIGLCEDTFDLRIMLECYYLSNVVMTLSCNESMRLAMQKNVAKNLDVVQRLEPGSPIDDYLVNYDLDIEFHHLLIKCAGNQLLLDLYDFLNPFLYINYVYDKQSKERLILGIREHEAIMNCLLAGNESGARGAIIKHLTNSKRAIISILKIANIS